MMEDTSTLYIADFGENKDMEEAEDDDIYDTGIVSELGLAKSLYTDLHQKNKQDTKRDRESFLCQHCDRCFINQQCLERHMHIHASLNNDGQAFKSNTSKMSLIPYFGQLDSDGSDMQLHTSSIMCSNSSTLSAGDHTAQPDKQDVSNDHHACKYCDKIFSTHTSKRRHEHRIHEQNLTGGIKTQLPQEENVERILSETSQQKTGVDNNGAPAAPLESEGEYTEQYMLDISSNISENLSFYIDGKIVSTSTVSSCEAAKVHSGTSTLVRLDSLILDTAHISQVLNSDSIQGKEIPGQPLAKRRTATPPLLPQIKTELESEVVVSSSSSSCASSLIENLLPQNTEFTIVQNGRTVFLSPKLKQLLEKQDGVRPALALIIDGQKTSSPVPLSVLPAGTGRFKRRTGTPPSSPPQNSTSNVVTPLESEDCYSICTGHMETQRSSSPVHQAVNGKDNLALSVEDPALNAVLTENFLPMASSYSCNQQPLDLSNTVKRIGGETLHNAVLDLSLQKKALVESEPMLDLVSQEVKEIKPNVSIMELALMDIVEKNGSLGSFETPLVTDFNMVTGTDLMTPLEPVAEGLVYGLALPPNSLTPSTASLTPVALQPASPCTIAFASPASHTMLPTTPPLITVLAPRPTSNPSNQSIQVFAPNISREPLVICTDNRLNSSECDLTTAFANTNSANLITLSQSLEPTLNIPGHVFLADQIALTPPMIDCNPLSEGPFGPTLTLNDSFINSYNITSNTVLIECEIAFEAPQSVIPAAITVEDNTAEPLASSQMAVNHIEQQILSVHNPESVDPTVLVSPIAESLALPSTTSVTSDCPARDESSPDPETVLVAEPPTRKEEEPADSNASIPEIQFKSSPLSVKAEEDESLSNTLVDIQIQTFTKNFLCNVCDKLFHSMKELGDHVGDHADEWPYKCEFCLLLFRQPSALLDHRSSLHGVGKTYVCSACAKDFVYLCNLKKHQEELHPGQQCTYTEEEKGKLRPQNYNNSTKVIMEPPGQNAPVESKKLVKKEEWEVDVAAEEVLTTIKIMASDGGKVKWPDVRLGINQHYPSFKPPPFPYHNRSSSGSMASATNFTTHNIPQTFSTAIRCTKCGKGFDNMPELHRHILTCANASDKRRYTPKKNPIPLRHFAKAQNGILSATNSTNGLNSSNRPSLSNRAKSNQESSIKMKLKLLNKRKKNLVQRVLPQRNKSVPPSSKISTGQVDEQQEKFLCPHCSREFTMCRSKTKHMAVCPKKPKEVKKRREGGISLTKENDVELHRGVEEKRQASPLHKTRLQTSGHAKRPAVLPVKTGFSNKRSKIIIKETMKPKQEASTLNELPLVRTFNPSMRQYSRVQPRIKGLPLKITIVKPPQTVPQKDELHPTQSQKETTRIVGSSSEQS